MIDNKTTIKQDSIYDHLDAIVKDHILKAGTYYIRTKHIRGFNKYFPKVDPSAIAKFELKSNFQLMVNFQSRTLEIGTVRVEGTEYTNPKSTKGLWYIENRSLKYIFADTKELVQYDVPEWKNYLRIQYEDYEKYGLNAERYLEVSDEELNRLDGNYTSYALISSNSNPEGYELVKLKGLLRRTQCPNGESPLYRTILSNSFFAKKVQKKYFDKLCNSKLNEKVNVPDIFVQNGTLNGKPVTIGYMKPKLDELDGIKLERKTFDTNSNPDNSKFTNELEVNVYGSKLEDVKKIKELENTINDLKQIIAEKELEIYNLKKDR